MRYFFRPQIALRNTDASGVLANNTDRAIGAADEHGFFAGGVQLIWRSVRSVGDDNRSTLPYRQTFCVIFWCKSCVAIFVKID